eukprot:206397-Prorocentrum_minimum.AAC.1
MLYLHLGKWSPRVWDMSEAHKLPYVPDRDSCRRKIKELSRVFLHWCGVPDEAVTVAGAPLAAPVPSALRVAHRRRWAARLHVRAVLWRGSVRGR